MAHAKVQHYVPQFLLRGFEIRPGSNQVYVYDKLIGKHFTANVRNVGAEKGFYDIVLDEHVLTFEPALSKLEAEAAEIIKCILQREQIGFLTASQRRTLASFATIQYFRTKQFRASSTELAKMLADAVDEIDPGAAERLGLWHPTDDEAHMQALRFLQDCLQFVPLIESKAWVLYEAPAACAFWISDHPIALHNTTHESTLGGDIGFAVPGIEIYLPLSPRFCLGFLCPSIRESFQDAYRRSSRLKEMADVQFPTHDAVGAAVDGFAYGFPIPFLPENVEYVNSLEVLWAERFVFSCHLQFEPIERMIRSNPKARIGPRPFVQ
jgi:hypothetical protein